VKNEGSLSIYSVTNRCLIRNASWAPLSGSVIASQTGVSRHDPPIPEIAVNEAATIDCPFPKESFNPGLPISSADIEIEVSYRSAFLPWRREKRFRFGTVKDKDGRLLWYPRPLSE
jgi:hypothetical protein